MCEPSCIKYTGGSSFTCSDKATARAVAKRTYESAVELFAMLCKQYNLNPTADGVIISHREGHSRGIASNHGDPEHLWNGLGMGYTMDGFRKAVKAKMNGSSNTDHSGTSGLQASALKNLSEADVIAKVGPLFTADQKASGILASVSLAQFILESGYGKSELAQNANNCFGMKKSLSGNTWGGSAWDGTSIYTKKTQEYENGAYVTVTADFRKYPSVEKFIADHSDYLLGAKNGSRLRYDGLKGCTDYKKAVQIIKDGGYATSPRNTLDCLKYIRQLKDRGIPVFFEKENINTMDAKGEVMLTIMASLAQQESESLSQNVKIGLQYRYQQGLVQVNHNRFLGYTKDAEGHLVIKPEEAEVVKRIYREYLEGASLLQIGKGLEADGILTGAGKKKWRPETIKKILQNEKYIGDALLAKTYTVDFLTKKRVKNNGIVPQYYVENSHEPIVPRDLYMQVQEEMVRRANLHSGENRKKRVYSSKYALSSIVYCPKCGEIYRRIAWNNRGKRSTVWRCCTRVEHGPEGCDA